MVRRRLDYAKQFIGINKGKTNITLSASPAAKKSISQRLGRLRSLSIKRLRSMCKMPGPPLQQSLYRILCQAVLLQQLSTKE
uniref:Uncharacterized protein n=1 Tax=Ditylenchus dipsaci TaxID=166011 RepID=A0A915EVB1_9BILA